MVCLKEERDGAIAVLTLNRPEARNAISPELITRLDAALCQLRDDDDVRVIVLAAEGDVTFCSGGDLKLMIPLITGARKPDNPYDEAALQFMRAKDRPLPIKGDIGKPLIAAIEGAALGGGLELVLACDIIVASRRASFAVPEVAAGAYPTRITFLLPQRIPYSVAASMLLAGNSLCAADAATAGLVTQLTEDGDALEAALDIARKIARNSPIPVRAARQVARSTMTDDNSAVAKLDRKMAATVYASDDAREGPRAFAQKRTPVFSGR